MVILAQCIFLAWTKSRALYLLVMSPERDLNPRPTAYKAVALPAELPGHKYNIYKFIFKNLTELVI